MDSRIAASSFNTRNNEVAVPLVGQTVTAPGINQASRKGEECRKELFSAAIGKVSLPRLSATAVTDPVYPAAMEAEPEAQAAVSANDSHARAPDAHGSGSAIPAPGTTLAWPAELD